MRGGRGDLSPCRLYVDLRSLVRVASPYLCVAGAAVNSWFGMPIYESKFVPKDTVLLIQNALWTSGFERRRFWWKPWTWFRKNRPAPDWWKRYIEKTPGERDEAWKLNEIFDCSGLSTRPLRVVGGRANGDLCPYCGIHYSRLILGDPHFEGCLTKKENWPEEWRWSDGVGWWDAYRDSVGDVD